MKDERNLTLDVVKGIAILLVLFGHIIQYTSCNAFDFFENKLFIFIYSFHMPLFMLVSGYLFYNTLKKEDSGKRVIKRLGKFLLLILFFTIINYYVNSIRELIINNNVHNMFSAYWANSLNGFWFLWSIIASTIIIALSYKITNNKVLQKIFLIILSPLVYLFPNGNNNLYMYIIFLIGFLYNEYKDKIPKEINKLKYTIFLIFPLMLFLWKKEMYIYISGMFNFTSLNGFVYQILIDIYRTILGIFGSIFVITGVETILQIKSKTVNILLNKLQNIGKNSLKIYLLQVIILENIFANFYKNICINVGKNIFYINQGVYYILVFITFISLIIFIEYIIKFLDKYKISKYLFLDK